MILLIAAILDTKELEKLGTLAQSLGMEVLLEVHDEEELNRSLGKHTNLVGVNNRNLRTFETDINDFEKLG